MPQISNVHAAEQSRLGDIGLSPLHIYAEINTFATKKKKTNFDW